MEGNIIQNNLTVCDMGMVVKGDMSVFRVKSVLVRPREFSKFRDKGSGCSTVVERKPHNIEIVGLNPTGSWAFFSLLSSQLCVLNSDPSRWSHS